MFFSQTLRLQDFRDDLEGFGVQNSRPPALKDDEKLGGGDEFGRSRDYHLLKTRTDRNADRKRRQRLMNRRRLKKLNSVMGRVTEDMMLIEMETKLEEVGGSGAVAYRQGSDGAPEIDVYGVDGWESDDDLMNSDDLSNDESRELTQLDDLEREQRQRWKTYRKNRG